MRTDVKLGFSECFGLVTVCIITKMFYGFLPSAIEQYATSAWYINLISALALAALFVAGVYGGLEKNRPAAVFMYLYFTLYTAMNLREVVRVIKIYNFNETPEWVFALAFLAVAVLVCKSNMFGGPVIAGFYSGVILFAFAVIFLLGINRYELVRLAPVGGYGAAKNAVGCITQMTVFSDVFLLSYLVTSAGGKKTAVKSGLWAVLVSSVVCAVSSVCYISVFDYAVASDKSSGLIEVVKNVYYGHLFQRMESLFFLVMIIASAVSVCVWFSGTVNIYTKAFGIEDAGGVILPHALVLFVLIVSQYRELFSFVGRYGGAALAILAAVVCIFGFIRRKA